MCAWRFRLLYPLLVTLCGSSVLLTALLFSPTVTATTHLPTAQSPITIVSESSTLNFPGSIDFRVTARDTRPGLQSATFSIAAAAPYHFSTLHGVLAPHKDAVVTFTWHEDLTADAGFLPPGTRLTYSWQFYDDLAQTYQEPAQTLTITDTRFPWQYATQGMMQVHWYHRSADFGQTVLTQALTSLQRIDANLGGAPNSPINLWVYQTETDFRGALPPGAHEWVGGIAFVDLNQALIVAKDNEDPTLVRDMPHELTHLVFHQLIAHGISAPTWFDEGLAVYNQNYHEPDMTIRFKQALSTHALLSFGVLETGFPADTDQAYLAYAQSWQFTNYLYNTFGINKMATLIKGMHTRQATFADDVTHSLGASPLQLENQWRSSLGQPTLTVPTAHTPSSQQGPGQATLPSVVDNTAPLYLLLGSLLIVLPLGGLFALFAYQRRGRLSRQAAQALHGQHGQHGQQLFTNHTPFPQPTYGPQMHSRGPTPTPNPGNPGGYPGYSAPYAPPYPPYPPTQPQE